MNEGYDGYIRFPRPTLPPNNLDLCLSTLANKLCMTFTYFKSSADVGKIDLSWQSDKF